MKLADGQQKGLSRQHMAPRQPTGPRGSIQQVHGGAGEHAGPARPAAASNTRPHCKSEKTFSETLVLWGWLACLRTAHCWRAHLDRWPFFDDGKCPKGGPVSVMEDWDMDNSHGRWGCRGEVAPAVSKGEGPQLTPGSQPSSVWNWEKGTLLFQMPVCGFLVGGFPGHWQEVRLPD